MDFAYLGIGIAFFILCDAAFARFGRRIR